MKRPPAAGPLAAASPGGRPVPTIGGYTADQRSSTGRAQVWRRTCREADLRQRPPTDPRSPVRRVPAAGAAEAGPAPDARGRIW